MPATLSAGGVPAAGGGGDGLRGGGPPGRAFSGGAGGARWPGAPAGVLEALEGRPLAVAVHGGAWSIPDALAPRNVAACAAAASAAYDVLAGGGEAVDAVEAAVRELERDESLNAGRGCSLTEAGEAECDALIMNGEGLRCGAVAGVSVLHPISLARLVMDRTEHVLLVGEGAMAFARGEGVAPAAREALVTAEAEEEWRQWREYRSNVKELFAGKDHQASHDTVGCVALDAWGGLACGTSTGGVVGKRRGRVGDSPLVGCGGYADAGVGAVSTTGHGEAIARVTLARLALMHAAGGLPPQEAAERALGEMLKRCGGAGGGRGGLISVSHDGEVVKAFTTRRMAWASSEGHFGGDADQVHRRSGVEPSDAA